MKKRWKSIAALLLVCILVSMAPGGRAARAVDLEKECSLTVDSANQQIQELAEANVVLDVYKVADAVAVEGYDTYDYTLVAPYDALTLPSAEERDNENWSAFAQEVAQVALKPENEPLLTGVSLSNEMPISPLKTGLYLVIPRGKDVEDYVTTVGTDNLGTKAITDEYEYIFSPTLVSLPSKKANDDGSISTGGSGDWLYDAEIILKPERTDRTGSLEIIKNVTAYVPGEDATFVFQVEGVCRGKHVLSDVVTIVIEEGTLQNREVIKDIPVGTVVTITEVYSGAVYQLVVGDDETKTVTIPVDFPAVVEFTNEPSNTTNSGGSITNEFVYNGNSDNWEWTPVVNHP